MWALIDTVKTNFDGLRHSTLLNRGVDKESIVFRWWGVLPIVVDALILMLVWVLSAQVQYFKGSYCQFISL